MGEWGKKNLQKFTEIDVEKIRNNLQLKQN